MGDVLRQRRFPGPRSVGFDVRGGAVERDDGIAVTAGEIAVAFQGAVEGRLVDSEGRTGAGRDLLRSGRGGGDCAAGRDEK